MIEPTLEDIGRKVVYYPRYTIGGEQEGLISSFNRNWVFVRYGLGCTSQATKREDLEWCFNPPSD
jgi:hypothetical protein